MIVRRLAPTTTLSTTEPVPRQKPKTANGFLRLVDGGEREVARILTLITAVVISAALIQLVISLGSKLLTGSEATWLGDDLIKVLGDLLTVLIALEVLQNITSYLRRHVVQIELVLVQLTTVTSDCSSIGCRKQTTVALRPRDRRGVPICGLLVGQTCQCNANQSVPGSGSVLSRRCLRWG